MFDYIVAVFKVIVGIFTPERIALTACIVFGVYVLWILLSLLFSFQSKFSRGCRKISELVDTYGLTSETYPKFVELGSKLPDSFLRGWKTFEHSNQGLPSEFIRRSDCLDLELSGGLFNQNRSTMRTYIISFSLFFGLIGVGNIGADAAVTAYALAEALVVPFVFGVVSMLTYYLYTAIRQHQYRVCVEDFNEMMDILNEKVENSEVEFAKRDYSNSVFVQNVVEPRVADVQPEEVIEPVFDENPQQIEVADEHADVITEEVQVMDEYLEEQAQRQETVAEEAIVSDHQVEVGDDVLPNSNPTTEEKVEPTIERHEEQTIAEPANDINQGETVMEQTIQTEPKRGRGRPKKEKAPEGELVIRTDEEFEEALARAEKLMKKNEEPLSASQQKRVEKALKELVDAMKKYKEEA
ncbi:MAG: hypothetical protein IJW24_04170 [Clostridia bacterium]|nr:hypothetical protein [Clostridia bacterium]